MREQLFAWAKQWEIAPFTWNLSFFVFAFILGIISHTIFRLFLKLKRNKESRYSIFFTSLGHFSKPLSLFIPLVFLTLSLPFLMFKAYEFKITQRCIEIATIITFSWLLFALLHTIQDYVLTKYNLDKEDNLRERKIRTQLQFLRLILKGLIILITIAAVLLTFSAMRKIGTGLLTGVGISGIIIGFAAQRTLANVLAGFQIAFTQPIRIDDVVVVEGEFGTIEEITLTYITIRIWDERRLVLPITYFLEKPFQNWTRKNAQLMGTVFLYTDYTIPVQSIRDELIRLLNNHPFWDKRASGLVVTDIKSNTVELRALMSAQNSSQLWELRCHIREHLLGYISENFPDQLPKTRAEINDSIDKNIGRHLERNISKQ
jgi:small-conductance mechanosensitive channel